MFLRMSQVGLVTPVGLIETMRAWADRSIRRTCGPVSNPCPRADGLPVS